MKSGWAGAVKLKSPFAGVVPVRKLSSAVSALDVVREREQRHAVGEREQRHAVGEREQRARSGDSCQAY